MIIDHLTQKGIMDAGLLYEQPFTGTHYQGLDGVFSDAVADEIVSVIDQINANAGVTELKQYG
jgi:type I restriction enzyme R subunit